MSVNTAELASVHHPLGTHGLWGHKDLQLPAYIQQLTVAIERGNGGNRSAAIAAAIGTCRRWAAGGGNVSPEVRVASAKAIAEFEALRARAHATKTSHGAPVKSLSLAVPAIPMVSSSDGPRVTVNALLKSPAGIRAAVRAHDRVPPQKRPAYRKKVIGAAKAVGAMGAIPAEWMK